MRRFETRLYLNYKSPNQYEAEAANDAARNFNLLRFGTVSYM